MAEAEYLPGGIRADGGSAQPAQAHVEGGRGENRHRLLHPQQNRERKREKGRRRCAAEARPFFRSVHGLFAWHHQCASSA